MKHTRGLVSVFLTCAGAVAIAAGITSVAFAGLVGNMPRGVAVNERTGKVYVANSGDDTVAVIQGEAQRVLATVPVGFFPFTIAVNVDTNRVYVVSMDSSVSVIDGVTNTVIGTIPLPPSSTGSGLAVDTQANRIRFSRRSPSGRACAAWRSIMGGTGSTSARMSALAAVCWSSG
jgi:YVTN family beta-propeller protein